MSFQAYLDTIQAKTGKKPEDLLQLARARGLSGPQANAGDVVSWLAEDFGLGRGHAMALFTLIKADASPRPPTADRIAALFAGPRARWRPAFDELVAHVRTFGDDVGLDPTDTYVSLTRAGRKFAVLAATRDRLDVGVKLPGEPARGRLAAAGTWNSMVTHRMKVSDPAEVDDELGRWLRQAYDAAAKKPA
jgi:hypothetical protein